ncbi:MAG: hypothetical protein HQ501_11990, partial [Rhodospirillales bacterium]|nr:hypothetical protein [Rhodospirillales bacterium]
MKQLGSTSPISHNPRFTPLRQTAAGLSLVVLASAALSGCGNLQWPPPGYGRQDGSAATLVVNNPSFVNASAVIVGPG